jgi:hypothetical protein
MALEIESTQRFIVQQVAYNESAVMGLSYRHFS